MFERLGSWTFRFRFLILVGWIVAAAFFATSAPSLSGQGSTDQTTFLPENSPSRVARDAIERAFPGSTSSSSATVTMDRPGGLVAGDLAWRDAVAAWVVSDEAPEELRSAVTDTSTADSRPELEALFRADDGTFELFVVNLNVADAGDEANAVVELLRQHLADTAPEGLEVHTTGAAAISSDYLEAVQVGTDSTTQVTIVLVILVLLAIYRAPLAALIPLVTIGVSYVVSKGVLGFLAAAGWQVSSTLETFLVVMVFGVGTDYAIFLISRYREEVSHDGDWHDAARVTVRRIGAVITASAGTVIVGMMAMGVGDFKMITSMGPGIAIAVAVTLVAALSLTPALLSIFGHYLFWPLHTREKHEGEPRGFFAGLARVVSRRPVITTIGLTAALLVPILYLPQVSSNFDVLADLPADVDSRIGYEQIGDHLGEDKLVQSTALIDLGDGDILAPAELAKLHALMEELHAGGGIATTTSIVTPDGDTAVPDGFRPSKTLGEMADGFAGDGGDTGATDNAGLLDPEVRDGLNQALDYVNGLAVAFPDAAGGVAWREARDGLEDAIDILDRVEKQSVVSSQLRTLSASITDPSNATATSGDSGDDADSTLMSDYLVELGAAFPEVTSLDPYTDAVKAARALEKDATVNDALALADAFDRLAIVFDDKPDATLSPESLAGTASAREFRKEAEATFDALPDRFTALAAVFAARPDDFYLPTSLTGEDADKLADAVDAFVSEDRTATRFYLTSSNAPYTGGAFQIIKDARVTLADGASAFGAAASGHIGGPTAQFADVQDTLARDFIKVGAITVLGILLVLMLLLRAVVAPLYLVATVLVSYGSTLGLSGFLFQEILGHNGVSPYLPLIVFVLLVALGSDYNIFLMHRIREEAETRKMTDAVRIASGHTGAVITSAGLILAGTFGSMATAPLTILFQVGVAVSIGVLIDTFLVRSILVPAITTIAGDWAWWPSRFRSGGAAPVPVAVPVGVGLPVPAGAAAVAATGAAIGAGMGATTRGTSRRRMAIALGLVIALPLLVAGLLTWSLGGAMDRLGSVQAAVVNLDEGGTMTLPDGTPADLALGADLSATLTRPGEGEGFAWVESDEASAAAGLADGRYAAVLTIPPEFSRTVAAIRSDTTGTAPRASLGLETNDGSGYALGTVARAISAAIATSTGQTVTASYVDDVLLAVTDAQATVSRAAGTAGDLSTSSSDLAGDASGVSVVAGQLVDGLQQLVDGTSDTGQISELVDGTAAVAGGVAKVADGADGLATGTRGAVTGATRLAGGANAVSDGMAALDAQTATMPAQVDQLADGADGIATGAAGIATGWSTFVTQTGATATDMDALAAQLVGAADGTSTGAAQAASLAAGAAASADTLATSVGGYTGQVSSLAAACVAAHGAADPVCQGLAALDGQGTGMAQLADGVRAQTDGASQAAAGTATGAAGTEQLARGVKAYTAGLEGGLTNLDPTDPANLGYLLANTTGLAAGAADYADGMRQFANGMPTLAGGISDLAAGTSGVADGAADLAAGLNKLAGGARALAAGAGKAADGAQALADGTASATGGLDKLTEAADLALQAGALVEAQADDLAANGTAVSDDAKALADDLDASAAGIGSYGSETRTKLSTLAADPVAIEATQANAVGGSQDGLAPFLMALAAWLGVMGAFLVLPAIWASDERRWVRGVVAAFAVAALVGVAGSLLMVAGLQVLLGVQVANPGGLILFAVLSTLAFTAIVQALVAMFGSRGWLVALLLLVVQVAAVAIPFAASMAPGPIAVITPFLPMTYAVDGFRGAIAGSGSSPAIDVLVLAAFLVVALLITLAAAAGPALRRRPDRDGLGATA
ncbi:MAG TPA: YhgE/Pip family protein [Candidatus Limnocylindrales bacterium]|nr:YhgE/Pip family protein [Candidatus Limnocylindrales bacterium]